jgi:NADH-quinone oxidoreductase subunit L
MAATIAVAQNDIKRVIAYSTLSQLGYMAMGAGVGAFIPAIFHLVTHAFFKGCLFLGAGSVIHGMHEEQDIQNMGGLRRFMPVTFWTFLIASLANAGLIPFAGFWSKDEIILGSWITNEIPIPIGRILAIVGLVTAFFTAYYMFRLVFLVFTGEPRYNTAQIRPHESPLSMAIPLVLLAIPSFIVGYLLGWPPEAGRIHAFLDPVFAGPVDSAEGDEVASLYMIQEEPAAEGEPADDGHGAAGAAAEEEHHVSNELIIGFALASTAAAAGGVLLAWLTYARQAIPAPEARAGAIYRFLRDKWRWDELYNGVIVRPLGNLADALWRVVDTAIIDGAVNGVAAGIGAVSQRIRHVQTGLVTNYALAIALGMVVLVGIYLGLSSTLFR